MIATATPTRAPAPRLTATEAWRADSILALEMPLDHVPQAIAMAYGSSVNHEAIIEEVQRRRSE